MILDTFKQLDKLYEDYLPVSATEEEQKTAEKLYLDNIEAGYLDLDSFHRAYDKFIEEENLLDIFNTDGTLAGKWIYGKIKPANSIAKKAILNLWIHTYSDNTIKPISEKENIETKIKEFKEDLLNIDPKLIAKYKELTGKSLEDYEVHYSPLINEYLVILDTDLEFFIDTTDIASKKANEVLRHEIKKISRAV